MGVLHDIGMKHGTDKATFHRYCDFYQDHLPGRGFDGTMLEIGVMDGASLKMWREYWPDALIIGVDNTRPTKVAGCYVRQFDATDPDDVEVLTGLFGPFDVILDDGSHLTQDQQDTFRMLYPALNPDGRYVIEDLHTSYMSNYVNSARSTLAWLGDVRQVSGIHRTPHGDPDRFVFRSGFVPAGVTWSGPDPAESITAIISA